ncbi:MAG: hypothetical protein RI907_3264 [Pseudomonadota bacterium]|jgi:PAS domain S-box-containing protein
MGMERWRRAALPVLGVVVAALLAWASQMAVVLWAESDFQEELDKRTEREGLDLEAMTLNGHAIGATLLAGQMSQEVRLAAIEVDEAHAKASNIAQGALQVLADTVGAQHAFVINADGLIVSSWDFRQLHSIGEMVSHRRYFQAAMAGKPSVTAAISISMGRRVYWVAAPIFADDSGTGPVIGVVATRFEMDGLDRFLGRSPKTTGLLVSPEGVVLAADRAAWRMRVVGELTDERLEGLRRSKQYGKQFEQPANALALPDFSGRHVTLDGRTYLVSTTSLNWNDPGGAWTLVLLGDEGAVVPMSARLAISAATLLLSLLVVGFMLRAMRDVEAKRLAEQQLQESQARLRAAARAGIVGVWDWDLLTQQLYWDPVMYRLYGMPEGHHLDGRQVWARTLHPDDRARVEAEFTAALKGESEFSPEYRVIWPDGSVHHLKGASRTEFNEQGRAVRMVGVNYDLTAQKQVAQQLAEARQVAEAASEAKSQFLANMSHEIRTPMNGVLGMLYLALKADLPPLVREQLTKAQSAGQAMLGLINDILDFSKVEAGKLDIEAVEFSLESVIERVTETVRPMVEAKSLEFLVRYDARIPAFLIGDPLRLGQILVNLCGNAVKFTDQGEIELGLWAQSQTETDITLQISVRDSGLGMDEDVQAHLFEKFMQADQSTTRRYGGTGLGLAISKNLVERMGGRLWVESSKPGVGTTMCLTVPMKLAADQPQRAGARMEVGNLLAGTRVLVVDDLPSSREILAAMVADLKMDVRTAGSGAEALLMLERASDTPFDVVLMDWRMPGMNGDEVIRRIHGNPAIAHRPKVIMVTAYGREDVMRLTEQAGADGFLVKPAHPSTLLDTILSVLGKRRLLSSPADEQATQATEADLAVQAMARHLAGASVLLVEDNEINREFVTQLLRSQGLAVHEAADGQQAVAMLQHLAVDAVLMDLQMPVMGGLEATRLIRQQAQERGDARLQRLPIIAMTALAMAGDADKSRAAGMNDHITKPIDPEHLLAVLCQWVAPGGAAGQLAGHLSGHLSGHLAAPAPAEEAATGPSAGEALPPDLASLGRLGDVGRGVRRIGGNVEAYRRQLQRFSEHHGHAPQRLEELVHLGDFDAASAHAHALKGVLGNLGFEPLFHLVGQMEQALREGRAPAPELQQALAQGWREALAEIDRARRLAEASAQAAESAQSAPAPAGTAFDPAALRQSLEALAHALGHDLGAATEPLRKLCGGVSSKEAGHIKPRVDHIAGLIDSFDIEGALSEIDVLRRQLQP